MASSSWATSRRLASAARVTGTEAPRRCAPWTPGPRRSIRTCARGYARSTARSSDARRTDRSSCGSLRSARSAAWSSAKFRRSAEAALLRRGRDRRSDLGRGQRDLAGPAAEGGRRGCENMSSHSHPTPRLPPLQPTGPSVGEGGLGPLTRDMY